MPAVILLQLPSGAHRLNRRLQQRFSLGIRALGNQLSREAIESWLVVEFRFHDDRLSQAAVIALLHSNRRRDMSLGGPSAISLTERMKHQAAAAA